jgi:hypothetical protein
MLDMNYKETNLSGVSWMRCRAVTIHNPLPGMGEVDFKAQNYVGPVAYFQEEKVISIDGAQTVADAGACRKVFNPAEAIPMLDPETGEPTGATVTQGELYVILFSLYMQTALERDGAQ